MSSTSTTTATETETSVLRTRAALKSFRESKGPSKTSTQDPAVPEGKYGPYFSPVSEPDEMKKIVGESISFELGAAAVLLQIAHPMVGKGVAAHSSFTYRRIERARRSIVYIYCMTFGTPEEKRIITDATHRAHSHVKGKDYNANDVDAQLWVAATIYWSIVLSYEMVFGKLEEERADRVFQEFSVMATALRVPPGKWPKDRAAFAIYWEEMLGQLEITDGVREIARDVMEQRGLPFGLTWMYATLKGPVARVMTVEMLPERIRNELGMPSTAYTRQMFRIITATNAMVVPYLPARVREFPKNYFMADMRRRIATGSRL
jgi:uncharacterized protein (DUF2236 family)